MDDDSSVRKHGGIVAVKDIWFGVQSKNILGFLGVNGAGIYVYISHNSSSFFFSFFFFMLHYSVVIIQR